MAVTQIPAPAGATTQRVTVFNTTGSWVAPAGATYAIAYLNGGGGGSGGSTNGAAGGSSSAFGFTATGGQGAHGPAVGIWSAGRAAPANSAAGATGPAFNGAGPYYLPGFNSTTFIFGSSVTPGESYTITVGAGGSAGNDGNTGGSGFVTIEWWA